MRCPRCRQARPQGQGGNVSSSFFACNQLSLRIILSHRWALSLYSGNYSSIVGAAGLATAHWTMPHCGLKRGMSDSWCYDTRTYPSLKNPHTLLPMSTKKGIPDPDLLPNGLTHFDACGQAHMVDVGEKSDTR